MEFKIAVVGKLPLSNESLPDLPVTYIESFGSYIAVGCSTGSIFIFKSSNNDLKQHVASFYHKSAISLLFFTSSGVLISGDSSGQLVLWDESLCHAYFDALLPSKIDSASENTKYYFFSGQFSEVIALNKKDFTLEFRLSSRLYPDWISGLFACTDLQIAGLTISGYLKIWRLSNPEKSVILEEEIRRLTNNMPMSVSNRGSILSIVSPKTAEFYRLSIIKFISRTL